MNVLEMIKEKLKVIGADGLCKDGCGCGLDDLVCCEADSSFCVPAKKVIAEEPGEDTEIGDVIYVQLNHTPHKGKPYDQRRTRLPHSPLPWNVS